MAVKLDRKRRWLHVRNYADKTHGIKLNFSSVHSNYYSAWKYTTKEDNEYLQSQDHPDLKNAQPPTQDASDVRKGNAKKKDGKNCIKRKRKSRLSIFDVSQLALEKGIHNRVQLLALANLQKKKKKEGKTDLAEFIAHRGYKAVEEGISIGWDIERALETLARKEKTRMEVMNEVKQKDCVPGCNQRWLSIAQDILKRNSIIHTKFSQAVETLLTEGRGKYRNLLLIGPHDCGKTFLFNPLNSIYDTFTNPATTNFAWVGAENSEVIFLNDFRWSEKIIPWHDLLLLLEGQTVHLPAPKIHYAHDIEFSKDAPIFATSKDEIVYVKGGALEARVCGMMRDRWCIFQFQAQIPQAEQ